MNYSIENCDKYIEVKQTGAGDIRVYVECIDAVLEYKTWTPGTPVLVDQTKLDASLLTVNDVQKIAALCGTHRKEAGSSKLAMLVARDLEFGMNRMWSVFVEDEWDVDVEVFKSKEQAVAWLTA